MWPLLLLLAAGGTAAAPAPSALHALEREQQSLFRRVAPAVVFIKSGDTFGSGFFVSADGLVLTNAHVVGTRKKVDVVLYSGQRLIGDVVELGANNTDVALVQVATHSAPTVELGGLADIEVGSWVGAVGHGEGAIWTFNSGMVSNVYPDGADRPVFQTQIPVNPGNSGGPIFNASGRVVGLVTAKIQDASDLNFGIGLDVARRQLKKLAELARLLVVIAPAGVPVFVDGTMVGTGPRVAVELAPATDHEVSAVIEGKMVRRPAKFPDVHEVDLTPPKK
jgi:S1-C subfamily serine protease